MTTIITRLYPDHASAEAVVSALQAKGLDAETIHIIAAGEGSEARMRAARVSKHATAAYARAMKPGNALVVVVAGFNPMGAARTAIRTVNRFPALDVGLADQDEYLREYPDTVTTNLLAGNPLVMSNPYRSPSHGHILGSRPLIDSKPRTSAMRGGGYMSKMFWPMKLVSTGRQASSAIRGGWLVSSMFGIPTLIGDLPSREMIPTKV